MDPDISIWQKTGHFYFALTGTKYILDNLTQPIYERCDSRLPSLQTWLALIIARSPEQVAMGGATVHRNAPA